MIDRTGAKQRAREHMTYSLYGGVGVELIQILSYLIIFLVSPINVGRKTYYLKVARNQKPKAVTVFDGLDVTSRAIWLSIVRWFFITAWSMTGLIPTIIGSILMSMTKYEPGSDNGADAFLVFGLILIILGGLWAIFISLYKTLSYSMCVYALADNPSLSALDCLDFSKSVTNEHIGELCMVWLTFTGWFLLNTLTSGLLGIFYLNPYIGITFADIFDQLNINANYDSIDEKASIKCISGMYKNYDFDIPAGTEIIVGRDSHQASVVIVDGAEQVSRKHCGIIFDMNKNEYRIVDYSQNGTYLADGTRLTTNLFTSVPRGTIIYLGDRNNGFKLC